jgi:hypothetical protein
VKSPRWEAIEKIVTSYINNGHPGYALAALALILVASIGIAGLAYLASASLLH